MQVELTDADVLFEDKWIIAVNKPAGLPTQGTRDPRRDHLVAALTRYLTARDGRPPYLGLHHRLDRDTSGVVVLARAKEANKGMTEVFRERLARKTYRALCVRAGELTHDWAPKARWTVDNHLGRARGSGNTRQQSVHSGGDRARTDFLILSTAGDGAHVEASPHTGRTHQIRVHLAEGGAPILGDALYKGPMFMAGARISRVMLHAHRLELPHPVSGAPLVFESPLPPDFLALMERLDLS